MQMSLDWMIKWLTAWLTALLIDISGESLLWETLLKQRKNTNTIQRLALVIPATRSYTTFSRYDTTSNSKHGWDAMDDLLLIQEGSSVPLKWTVLGTYLSDQTNT